MGVLSATKGLVAILVAIALDDAWRDLRFIYVLPGWIVFS